ncbi:multimerin-2a isoform X2 [Solea solea]|uniref:multimerin-2a isoform X2 n=1 Tax=Solea solea TaxID=90069 RepID=UPI00272AC1FE|nr:multimerin-2a isoform X2 [Solea solea]
MTAAELVLVVGLLGLLLSAQCKVRARDPGVEEEEEEEQGGRGGGGVGGFSTVVTSPTGDRGNDADRTGYNPVKQKISAPLQRHRDVQDQHNEHTTTHPAPDTGHAPSSHHTSHAPDSGHTHHSADMSNRRHGRHHQPHEDDAAAHYYPEVPAALPVPDMMALLMSQLQPLLHNFNRSLEHLTRQVGDLAQEVLQLRSGQSGAELQLQAGTTEVLEHNEEAEEILDAKLDEVYEHIREVQAQLETHRLDTDSRLHSQHAMLHYNLTSFKMDMDVKLKRQQKMLQISLQAMDLKVNQDQTTEAELEPHAPPPPLMPRPLSPTDSSTLWEAIKRLDNMVVNNTVKVGGLTEDVDVTSGNIQRLRFDLTGLDKLINQTARRSQVLFMETGLEVEEAKVGVLKKVDELTRNMTQHNKHLQEVDVDIDYLFTALYRNHSAPDCDCKALTAAVVQLERGVANVTALANENRLALEADDDGGVEQWDRANDWEPAVEALQRGLQLVKESVVLEQTRSWTLSQTLNQTVRQLSLSVAEVSVLKRSDEQLRKDLQKMSGSFDSLLRDAIRHSDVLELLLGEEVLEFLEWPVQDQEAQSIPALKEQLRNLQEELRGHSLSIASLLSSRAGGREEVPSADQPSFSSSLLFPHDQIPGGTRRRSNSEEAAREQQLFLRPDERRPEHEGDGSDLWNLEKMVQDLELKVKQLEDKPCPCPSSSTEREVLSKLQEEVTWLKRGLEEHLRVFKNVFTNTDVLVASDAALDLDQVWQLVKNQKTKKERKRGGARGGGEEPGRRGNNRNRRDLPGGALLSEDSVMFVASLRISNSAVMFDTSLNPGHFHSDTGTFTAPVDGVYVFILTFNLKSGSAHVVLRKVGGVSVSLNRQNVTAAGGPATSVALLRLRKGEEIWLELRGGAWADSEDNVFTGLLLHRTT